MIFFLRTWYYDISRQSKPSGLRTMDMKTIGVHKKIITMLGCVLLLSAAGVPGGCTAGVSRDVFFEQLQEGNAPVIVDVRTQREYDRDHIPGAVRIPFYALGTRIEELGMPRSEPVVLYCEHGPRAALGAFFLRLAGYQNLYSLDGHMTGWRKSQLPVEMIEPVADAPKKTAASGSAGLFNTADGRLEIVTEPVFRGQAAVFEAGFGHATSVVLIHGVGDSGMKDWKNVVPVLAAKYHVLAFDLPGFGRSSKQNVLYSPQRYADFVGWVVRQRVKGPFFVIGHSLGGAVALRYAASDPEGLERLILADTAGVLHRVAFTKSILQIGEGDGKRRARERSAHRLNEFTRALLDDMERDGVKRSIEGVLADPALRLAMLNGSPLKIASLALILDDMSDVFERVRVPSLVVWGEQDDVAPLRTASVLGARLPFSRVEFVPKAGHSPMLDQPARFNEVVLAELAKNGRDRAQPVSAITGTGRRGVCSGESGRRFTGAYDLISLKDCKDVEITNAMIGKLEADGSEAVIEHASISGSDIGLKTFRSELTLTDVEVSADVPIEASRSRLDCAAVKLAGRKAAVVVLKESFLVFSVSRVESPLRTGFAHGVFKLAEAAY